MNVKTAISYPQARSPVANRAAFCRKGKCRHLKNFSANFYEKFYSLHTYARINKMYNSEKIGQQSHRSTHTAKDIEK